MVVLHIEVKQSSINRFGDKYYSWKMRRINMVQDLTLAALVFLHWCVIDAVYSNCWVFFKMTNWKSYYYEKTIRKY
ncbi:MAG TPA: hypothetical protein ACFYEK_08350 [Candidatus Wunengus sp. YC60]|uniref:hypothetical protein n=1 Tax=Candidatus Wunengus sp. YC60 TaxID=3367697 RepID=UPI0040257360